MASVNDLGNGRFRIFICNGFRADGKVNRTSKVITAKSKRDAEKQAQALEVDFKRGQQIQFSNAPTFTDLVAKWGELEKPDMGFKSQGRYEGFLKHFMLPYFGRMKVRDIKAIHIETYLKSLKKDGIRVDGKTGGYSEKTIYHHYMFIQTLLNHAVRWDSRSLFNGYLGASTPKYVTTNVSTLRVATPSRNGTTEKSQKS